MLKRSLISCGVFVVLAGMPRPAAAEWLLTGFVAPIFGVSTSATSTSGTTLPAVPAENFDSSTGFGFNLASAFPSRGNLGFELDFGYYPNALKTSDQYDTAFASSLMTISPNFFYSPSIPRVRPYFAVGPNFGYRKDKDEAIIATPSGWAVGLNAGGGVMFFANEHFGGRVDFRYYRNFGDFYDLRTDATTRQNGWSDLQFFRLFFGATVVLH
jgi:opacity protein-like surface antigen